LTIRFFEILSLLNKKGVRHQVTQGEVFGNIDLWQMLVNANNSKKSEM